MDVSVSTHSGVRSAPPLTAEHLQRVRYLAFGRALPAVLFAVLGYRVLELSLIPSVHAAVQSGGAISWLAGPLPTGLYFLFCAIPVGIYLTRPAPRARDGRILPRVAGLAGTTMLLVAGAFPDPVLVSTPEALRALSTPLTIAAFTVALYGMLHLRRNLAIIPEARRLVTGGPYRAVRHPLYAAEIMVAAAMVLGRVALWPAAMLLPFVAVQLLRSHYEERLLGATFAEYAAYARRTARIVPGVL